MPEGDLSGNQALPRPAAPLYTRVVACPATTEFCQIMQAAASDQPGQDWQQGLVPKQQKQQLAKVRHPWFWVRVSPQDPQT